MPLGADLLSKFRKDKVKENETASKVLAEVRNHTFIIFSWSFNGCSMFFSLTLFLVFTFLQFTVLK